ncbi:MAG: AAA domain-containing protein [Coriobacteriales bacterium]|nr:AAA domain-containing protein [Coriobacteriales bacterium]
MSDEFSFDIGIPEEARRVLERYRRSVFAEMYYLRDNGGRRYKVTNGVRIGRVATGFVYCFDMEAELFLADSSPISVSHGDESSKGTVLSCEDFQITVILEADLGERLSVAYIHAEPWKLLEALNARLALIKPSDGIAMSLMGDGPALATGRPIGDVTSGQGAAKDRVRDEPITVIWGPPGTGKTHTMAEVAIERITSGKSVLVVSHSNISVDGVVSKVAELMRARDMEDLLWRGMVMRFGHVRDEGLAKDEDVVAYNYALGSDPDRKEELEALYRERDRLRSAGRRRTMEMAKVQQQIRRIRAAVEEDEKMCVNHARLVATTVSKLYANRLFEGRKYDLVMFDEVSMAYVPQVICAAMHARERLVLVGDFRQLAPISQGRASRAELSRDVFSYLGIVDSRQVAHYHPWLVMLDEQRRMHPRISAFPSYEFYDRLLKDHGGVREAREGIARGEPLSGSPMALVDLRGTFCPAMANSDHSRFNILGAIVSFGMALEAARGGAGDIGIIAPYVAQVRLIRAMLRDWKDSSRKAEREGVDIACSTVHQFQGSERDVIVLDTVESYPARKPGILTSSEENGSVGRLVNVAATRARGKLVTVSNASFWSPPAVERTNAFARLVMHHRTFDKVVAARGGGITNLLRGIDFGPNIRLLEDSEAEEAFLKDIRRCSQRIVISIPDGKLDEPYATKVIDALREVRGRGVEVLAKCYSWTELSDKWRGFGWQSDDAVFPLVVLDGTVCWYGMPPSRGRHASKGVGIPMTTVRLAFRIEGRATIPMIWSLTGLDNRSAKGSRQSLQERRGTTADDKDGTAAYGLSLYLQKYHKCPKCKSPIRLAKGYRSGKFYLKCSKCDETGLLYKDDVNNYIRIHRPGCPQCKGYLTARVSRYGLFIKCNNGHTVRPDQI